MAITNSAGNNKILLFNICLEVLTREIDLPLQLVCHESSPQRSAAFKISLDSDLETLSIQQLFPGKNYLYYVFFL